MRPLVLRLTDAPDSPVMAQECNMAVNTAAANTGLKRYTIYVQWPDQLSPDSPANEAHEEIDVDAKNDDWARTLARDILDRDYAPDWRILAVQERFGLYM